MELIFTKRKDGKYDHLAIWNAGELRGEIECPKQGIIPHDMVHYGVEHILQKRGFIGRVAAGEAAVFQMQGEAESNGVERLVEVFQADGWAGWSTAAEDMLDLYQVTCAARQCPALPLQVADVEQVRQELLRLSALWQTTEPGQSLHLEFTSRD
ncbi:hypothetical protein RF679_18255 [Undibacterium cyanobacteriorum]|uniref:Uncharacterized protein n=1 Tax=Undibacterium cyanobacteriorum TaxID=3073561 RepID=A0ABY9RJX3_9BURK|nr:hypothetical protein [Undibacterium sp. 20NA77.5]WMW80560.1 hypothetical protein RF679_18255 [Undibacterium sp. 20NA77.5]